jgi:diadenosine tetraphosphatase ApaH/serine/threonine PP2A family protein phosphatase
MTDESFDFPGIFEALSTGNHLPEATIISLVHTLQDILYQEPNLLELQLPITICGDTHGQIYDLVHLFEISGKMTDDDTLTYLFLGDYIDRGFHSMETFAFLAALKVKYPNRIWLLRGNHESRQVSHLYGFYNDCLHIYGHVGIWTLCNEIFDLLPLTAVIGKRVFCTHGGLSKGIDLLDQIDLLMRRVELPSEGPLCDICWSDPDDVQDWSINQRGAGWLFGAGQVRHFLHLNGLSLVARAHQLAQEGFQWYFDKTLITVWSAPNFCGWIQNAASVVQMVAQTSQFDQKGGNGPPPFVINTFKARPDSHRIEQNRPAFQDVHSLDHIYIKHLPKMP